MIISHKHKFIFLKTRKTAGSTLEKLLFPHLGQKDICTGSPRDDTPRINTSLEDGHVSWDEIQSLYPNEFRDYFKFTIERNPWDKVVSAYYWHKIAKKDLFGSMSFEEYVTTRDVVFVLIPSIDPDQDNLFLGFKERLPTDWLRYADRQDVNQMNIVYKYEEMDTMYEDLNQRFGLDIKNWKNTRLKSDTRKIRDYRKLYTNVTIDVVAETFAKEIKTFGYTYE